ncbi:hypothetical protein [Neisseria dentiae]|uniref:hypothetical protein n=1 Tax=Neisseria dentiae TaxID=194197 RepID=UPI0035A09DBB
MPTNTRPAVSLQAVSHRYGKTLALDNVPPAIPRGVTASLIRPNIFAVVMGRKYTTPFVGLLHRLSATVLFCCIFYGFGRAAK